MRLSLEDPLTYLSTISIVSLFHFPLDKAMTRTRPNKDMKLRPKWPPLQEQRWRRCQNRTVYWGEVPPCRASNIPPSPDERKSESTRPYRSTSTQRTQDRSQEHASRGQRSWMAHPSLGTFHTAPPQFYTVPHPQLRLRTVSAC